MLAMGLLVVRHSDGFCNRFQLKMEAYDRHRREQRPIPWAKAAYLQELEKPVSGFWGAFGGFWGVRVHFQHGGGHLSVASTEWAPRSDHLFGDRGIGVILAPPQPLPFIFLRGPRWCHSVARRQRLIAVLLSQHPRAGCSSPLCAITDAGLLRMILNAACPDLKSSAQSTGGSPTGSQLADISGGGVLTADGAGGSATTTVCDPVNGDIWVLVETQVSQFRATNLSEFSEGREGSAQDTREQGDTVLAEIMRFIATSQFADRMPIYRPFDVQVQLQAVQAAFERNAWSENPASQPFFDWALLYIAAASGCKFWDLNGGVRAAAAVPELPGSFPRNACAMKQYVVVGGDVLRLFQSAHSRFQVPVGLSEKDRFSLTAPCDLIFTSVGSLGWMVVSIDNMKRAVVWTPEQPVLTSVATAGNNPLFEKFKRHLKGSLNQLGSL